MAKSTSAHLKTDSSEVTIRAHDTDSPILPVEQLVRLHEFRPDLVDFVIEETRAEAAHRRKNENRKNVFVFLERMMVLISVLAIATLSVGGAIYITLKNYPVLGGTIVTVGIGTLAVAYLRRDKDADKAVTKTPQPSKK